MSISKAARDYVDKKTEDLESKIDKKIEKETDILHRRIDKKDERGQARDTQIQGNIDKLNGDLRTILVAIQAIDAVKASVDLLWKVFIAVISGSTLIAGLVKALGD